MSPDHALMALLLAIALFASAHAHAKEKTPPQVRVVDAYVELHTGPGRGYPVFHVVERGGRLEILKRRTDWFKVRATNGKQGWVTRTQLERTLSESGMRTTFMDKLIEDYLRQRVEFGLSGGVLDGEPMVNIMAGYRMTRNFALELAVAQVAGSFSNSLLYYGSIVSYPFPDWRITPLFSLGVGQFRNVPRQSLVGDETTDSTLANVALGAKTYLTRNFSLRAEARNFLALVDDNQNEDFWAFTLGMTFFF